MRQASSWSGMLGFPRSGKNWQSSVHDVTSLVWPGPGPGPATTELWDRASGRTQVSIPAWGVRDGRRVPGCQTEPWPLVSHTGGGGAGLSQSPSPGLDPCHGQLCSPRPSVGTGTPAQPGPGVWGQVPATPFSAVGVHIWKHRPRGGLSRVGQPERVSNPWSSS